MKDCLDTCTELVKFSPKWEAMLHKLKEEPECNAINVRALCPIRAECPGSILANYDNIRELWETALRETSDTERFEECKLKWNALSFVLTEMILRHTDKLSETLQDPKLSGVEGHEIAMLTVKTLKSLWTHENFYLFCEKIEKMMNQLDVDEQQGGLNTKKLQLNLLNSKR